MFRCRDYIQVSDTSFIEIYLLSLFSTVVLTDELRANIRACGFASAGRHVALVALLPMVDNDIRIDLALVEVNILNPLSYR